MKKINYQLLVFCDTSKYAYAATVYLRQEKGERCTNSLIFSKTRLAPNKDISIPRFELLATLVGVRCTRFVEKELNLELKQKHTWLDSQCILNWIGNRRTFSTFVENRLKEIRKQREIKFHYITSSENPVDIASRGLGTQGLRDNNLWWSGPEWLLLPSDSWPIWKLNNMDNDIADHTDAEGKTYRIMYEAELVAGEGRLNKQDVSVKVSAPLNIDISRFSQLIRFARVSSHVVDFNARNKTAKLLQQGYRYHKLRKTFSKFYRRHYELVSNFSVGLKTLLHQGLSEPEFYGDLVYKFKKIVGRADFSDQFRKIIVRYKRIGYNINIMRQSACLVFNPIMVNNFASLFKCTPVGRASDSMMAPT